MRALRRLRMSLSIGTLFDNNLWGLSMTTSTPVERRRARARLALLSITTALCSYPAAAQTGGSTTQNTPAEKYAIAPGGVDMRTGRYVYTQTDLAIGGTDQASSLKLVRTMPQTVLNHASPFGNMSHNWDISIEEFRNIRDQGVEASGNDYRMVVSMGGRSETFDAYSNSAFTQVSQADLALLAWTGDRTTSSAVYTMTDNEGAVFTFRPIGSGDCSSTQRCADIASITEPDGTVYTFSYAPTGVSGNGSRLTSVVSSRGYAVMLEGAGTLVNKACALNLASAQMPANGVCPVGAPTSSYGYDASQRLITATDVASNVSSFGYGTNTGHDTMTFTKPGETSPWLTNTVSYSPDEIGVAQQIVDAQAFADGRTYAYSFETAPGDLGPNPVVGGTYTDNLSRTVKVLYGFPRKPGSGPGQPCNIGQCTPVTPIDGTNPIRYQQTSGPVQITDELDRTTSFDYCTPGSTTGCYVDLLQSFTDPAGIKTVYTYAGSRNIGQMRRIAKPGSGLADILTSATYNCSLAKLKSCNKPLTVTDGNSKTTAYTYKEENGQILTETQPAGLDGIAPVKRYDYVQRYAWIVNGSGGYVHSGSPIWLLGTEKTCRTTATSNDTCAGGAADELVTTYDYGPDSGPNTLLLRGKVVTTGGTSLRTCYRYDDRGNKIAETSPRAGLTNCPAS